MIVINKYLVKSKKTNREAFNYFLKLECFIFLKNLTGNESFYPELFKGYNNQSVYLDIDGIIDCLDNCYDILTDYTDYKYLI